MANVTEMPPAQAAEIADAVPEFEPNQPTSTSKPAPNGKNRGGRPPKGHPNNKPEGKAPVFFKNVEQIPQEDWGTRAFLYLYIDEPVCIAKTWGETRYAKKFHAPIFDLEPLKDLYGSFKGWLSLNIRKTGKDATDQTDRLDFEIFDPLCPPKIPRKAWANDDRNRRWEALLPPEKPSASESTGTMIDAMKMYKEIRNEVKDEIPAVPEPSDPTRSTLETMKLAKELFAPPATGTATPPTDPFDLAAKIMAMRSNDPMMAVMMELLKNANTANEAARQREYELLKEKTAAPTEKPKTLMEQLTDFKALKDLFTGNGDGPVRVGRTTALDVTRDIATKFFESDLASGVGQWLGSLAQRNVNGNPAPSNMNGTPTVQVQQQSAPDQFQAFIQNVLNPALLRHYLQEFSGADFAGWLYDGYPDRLIQLQSFTHPMMPGLKGAPAIIQAYKRTDSMWPALSSRGEQAFADFVHQFCEWKPEAAVDAEVIEAQPEEEGEEKPERI